MKPPQFSIRQLMESIVWLSVSICSFVGVYRVFNGLQGPPAGRAPQHGDGPSVEGVALVFALWFLAWGAFSIGVGVILKRRFVGVLGIALAVDLGLLITEPRSLWICVLGLLVIIVVVVGSWRHMKI